jgi:hypothetical protein
MKAVDNPKDLVVLAADKDIEYSIKGILSRPESLDIKRVEFDIYSHPEKDPGCFWRGHDFLRPFVRMYRHALIILDRDGCGREGKHREDLEAELEDRLASSGWEDRAAALIIAPELENWVWSDSPEVDAALGWRGKSPALRDWLKEAGYWRKGCAKPDDPKKAVEDALRRVHKPRSSAIYLQLARNVSLVRCDDPAFLKLKERLSQWFSVSTGG